MPKIYGADVGTKHAIYGGIVGIIQISLKICVPIVYGIIKKGVMRVIAYI